MRLVCQWLVFALPWILRAMPAGADETEDLLNKYTFCLVCHGYQGQGNVSVQAPALAGIEPWYFAAALDSYRSGQRHTSSAAMDMQSAARMIEPASYDELHAFVSALAPGQQPAVAAVAEQVQRGAAAYAQYCAVCHGSEAEGNEQLAAPALKRLAPWYLTSAWQAYLTGARGDDKAALTAQQMRQIALSVPAEIAIEDLIAFLTK